MLPFLLDGALVARVDLKADRKAGALAVLGTYFEPGERLGNELRLMAAWLGLSDVAAATDASGAQLPKRATVESRSPAD